MLGDVSASFDRERRGLFPSDLVSEGVDQPTEVGPHDTDRDDGPSGGVRLPASAPRFIRREVYEAEKLLTGFSRLLLEDSPERLAATSGLSVEPFSCRLWQVEFDGRHQIPSTEAYHLQDGAGQPCCQ